MYRYFMVASSCKLNSSQIVLECQTRVVLIDYALLIITDKILFVIYLTPTVYLLKM